jgi:HPt (histidine-containing phosphotransfer) domain-containing protein
MNSPDQRHPLDATDSPAVNHAGGVARLMGDGALFGRVLARFRNEYRQAAAGIRTALDEGNTTLALRLVHTLKGAAGMIEAVPLRRQADAVERMLHSGTGDVHGSLVRLQGELERVLRELDALASTLPDRRPAAPAARPAQAHRDVVRALVTLLDEGNGDAVDLVREAGGALAAELGEDGYRQVADLVEGFDFDSALALLRERVEGG